MPAAGLGGFLAREHLAFPVGGDGAVGSGGGPGSGSRACHRRSGLLAWDAKSAWTDSRAFLVIFSVPSRTALMAALRISQSRLPIIPLVRWCSEPSSRVGEP